MFMTWHTSSLHREVRADGSSSGRDGIWAAISAAMQPCGQGRRMFAIWPKLIEGHITHITHQNLSKQHVRMIQLRSRPALQAKSAAANLHRSIHKYLKHHHAWLEDHPCILGSASPVSMSPTTDVLLAAPPLPSLGLTLGVIEVGALISTLCASFCRSPPCSLTCGRLYGTVIVQTYLYAISFPRDRKWIQAVVGSVLCVTKPSTTVWKATHHRLARSRRCILSACGHTCTISPSPPSATLPVSRAFRGSLA
jgi:hypothetical protein